MNIFPQTWFIVGETSTEFTISDYYILEKGNQYKIKKSDVISHGIKKIKIGTKFVGYLKTNKLEISKIIANNQPFAKNETLFLSSLKFGVDDRNKELNYELINELLSPLINISIKKITDDIVYDVIIKIVEKDVGTENCPFFLIKKTHFPKVFDFPKVSNVTVRYLNKIFNKNIKTDLLKHRIFIARLIHLFFHILEVLDHTDGILKRRIQERNAIKFNDSSLINDDYYQMKCFADWESLHLMTMEDDFNIMDYDKLLCSDCKSKERLGFSYDDAEDILSVYMDGKIDEQEENKDLISSMNYILYLVDMDDDYAYLNYSNHNSEDFNVIDDDLYNIMWKARTDFSNIKISRSIIFGNYDKGYKLYLKFNYKLNYKNNKMKTMLVNVEIINILKNNIHIINNVSYKSKLKKLLNIPLQRLSLTLKISDFNNIKIINEAIKVIKKITNWNIIIIEDAAFSINLGKILNIYDKINNTSNINDKNTLYNQSFKIINKISPIYNDIMDNNNIVGYIFPNSIIFTHPNTSNVTYGIVKDKTYFHVKIPEFLKYQYPLTNACNLCTVKLDDGHNSIIIKPKNMLATVIIHEVLHIIMKLTDHKNCEMCTYSQNKYSKLKKIVCWACMNKGDDKTTYNCIMSHECIACITKRIKNIKKIEDMLCDKCIINVPNINLFPQHYTATINDYYLKLLIDQTMRAHLQEL